MAKTIRAADLFCGAGGFSTGLERAAEATGRRVELVAVNHWHTAVETHSQNHPRAVHFCEDLTTLDPRKAVPGGKLDLLVASPECTHHSNARGGKPMADQSRASAWCVLRWATALQIDRILIENVREFTNWGPLGANGRPLKRRRGETFHCFIDSLRSLGYTVEWRLLNAADFGGATTRIRLFIQAVRGRRQLRWPEPTHARNPGRHLFGELRPWRAAREVIDWQLKGQSITNRKRPLSDNTLKRIAEGLRRFGGEAAEPFLLQLTHGGRLRSLDSPVPTVTTAKRGEIGLVEPFVVGTGHPNANGSYVYSADSPLPTITSANDHALVEPFMVNLRGTGADQMGNARGADEPTPTITAGGNHIGLVEPCIMSAGGPEVGPRSVNQPLNTVLTRDHMALVEPFFVQVGGPTGKSRHPHSVNDPLATITTENHTAVVEPFLVPFSSSGVADSVDEPVRTLSTRDRLGLAEQVKHDILFRMLQPHELSLAMGFAKGTKFAGTRGDQVKQIGNAVEVHQAEALTGAVIAD